MPIFGKTDLKVFISGAERLMNLKLGMQHWRLRLYLPIVYLNNDPFGQLYKKGQCLLDYSMEKDNGKKGLLLAHLSSAQDELL